MSQFILDEQLDVQVVVPRLRRWTSVTLLRDLRPSEVILDDRIPAILLELDRPTLVTIDQDLWDRRLCHPHYGILVFALRDDEQELLTRLLRDLLKLKEFRTRSARMGKVVRIAKQHIDFFEHLTAHVMQMEWRNPKRRKNRV